MTMLSSSTPPSEKADILEVERGNGNGIHNGQQADPSAQRVTMESFSHLDEKKILRKVLSCCILLSFLN